MSPGQPEIGERVLILKATVETDVPHIFTRPDVRSRAELTAQAVRRNARH
jgi:DNA-binding NarL/FixJ family response regulator